MESKVCSRSQGQPSGARRRAIMAIASASGSAAVRAAWSGSDEGTAIPSTLPDAGGDPCCSFSFQFLVKEECIMLQHMLQAPEANSIPARRRSRGGLLLALPYLGLCFPQLYARATPA